MTLKKRGRLSRNCEKITAAVIATTMSKSAIVKKEKNNPETLLRRLVLGRRITIL